MLIWFLLCSGLLFVSVVCSSSNDNIIIVPASKSSLDSILFKHGPLETSRDHSEYVQSKNQSFFNTHVHANTVTCQ